MVSYAKSIYDRENGRITIIMTTKDKGNCKRDLYQKTLRLKQFVKHQICCLTVRTTTLSCLLIGANLYAFEPVPHP